MSLFPREMQSGDRYFSRLTGTYLQIMQITPQAGDKVQVTHADGSWADLNANLQYTVRPARMYGNVG